MKKLFAYLLCFSAISLNVMAEEAEVYDTDPAGFTDVLADGSVLDQGVNTSEAQTAIDSNGIVYTVFVNNNDGPNELYIHRLKSGIVETWGEIEGAGEWTTDLSLGEPINAEDDNASSPKIVIDNNNEVVIAYLENNESPDRLFIVRYDGIDFGTPDVIDTGAEDVSLFDIGVDNNNNIYAAFAQDNDDSGYFELYLSRYNATSEETEVWDSDAGVDGEWSTDLSDGTALDTETNDVTAISMAIDSSNRVHVHFIQNDDTTDRLYALKYSSSVTLTNALDSETAQDAHSPEVIADSTGQIYFTYIESDGDKERLYLGKYNTADGYSVYLASTSDWDDDLTLAEAIDTNTVTVDSVDLGMNGADLYVAFSASDEVFLSRYNNSESTLGVWEYADVEKTSGSFVVDPVNDFVSGDAVSRTFEIDGVDDLNMSIDYAGNAYIMYVGTNESDEDDIYLSRFDGTTVKGWDNTAETPGWASDPDDSELINAGSHGVFGVDMALDHNGVVYFSYINNAEDDSLYLGAQGRGRTRPVASLGRRSSSSTCVVSTSSNYSLIFVAFAMALAILSIPVIRNSSKA